MLCKTDRGFRVGGLETDLDVLLFVVGGGGTLLIIFRNYEYPNLNIYQPFINYTFFILNQVSSIIKLYNFDRIRLYLIKSKTNNCKIRLKYKAKSYFSLNFRMFHSDCFFFATSLLCPYRSNPLIYLSSVGWYSKSTKKESTDPNSSSTAKKIKQYLNPYFPIMLTNK